MAHDIRWTFAHVSSERYPCCFDILLIKALWGHHRCNTYTRLRLVARGPMSLFERMKCALQFPKFHYPHASPPRPPLNFAAFTRTRGTAFTSDCTLQTWRRSRIASRCSEIPIVWEWRNKEARCDVWRRKCMLCCWIKIHLREFVGKRTHASDLHYTVCNVPCCF